jgi:hypothetical protein
LDFVPPFRAAVFGTADFVEDVFEAVEVVAFFGAAFTAVARGRTAVGLGPAGAVFFFAVDCPAEAAANSHNTAIDTARKRKLMSVP